METIILAGGLGTRLAEETQIKPKPMVEIGGRPILWHLMSHYERFGFKDFTIALGYKGHSIKEFFLNYAQFNSDLTVDLATGNVTTAGGEAKDWRVNLVDTGQNTLTGGRLHRLEHVVKGDTFMLTYGDGLANVDLKALVDFHHSHGKTATVTAVRPSARFGGMKFHGNQVTEFKEKPQTGEGWINGGFFVFNRDIFKYLKGDQTILEREPLENLVNDGALMAHHHGGFWQCMDTLRDKQLLESLYVPGESPWETV